MAGPRPGGGGSRALGTIASRKSWATIVMRRALHCMHRSRQDEQGLLAAADGRCRRAAIRAAGRATIHAACCMQHAVLTLLPAA